MYDRSVVSSITDKNITSDLAIRTLTKALESQRAGIKPDSLLLHSDQGSQFTSKEFTEYCESKGIIQSMSKAGYPYDNAPMERYFNTLKNELLNLHIYHTDDELNQSIASRHLRMYIIIMSVHIPTMDIELHLKHVIQRKIFREKCYKKD